jgi:hypothetical protein
MVPTSKMFTRTKITSATIRIGIVARRRNLNEKHDRRGYYFYYVTKSTFKHTKKAVAYETWNPTSFQTYP